MPWHVEQGGGTCGASQWAVIKDDDGSTAGCHASKAEADAQLAALYASERDADMRSSSEEQRAEAAATRREAMSDRSARPQLAERQQRTAADGDKERIVSDRYLAFPAQFRTETIERDGKAFFVAHGTASAFEQPYEMWDEFGPYDEVVSRQAADATLAGKPDVVFLINHRGLSLARTGGPWNGGKATLELSADENGLHDVAWLNPERTEVQNLRLAIEDNIVTEQSFAFMIDDGEWSEDFTVYRINRFDLNRGDVSAVNYGANPYTSIAARQQEILTDLRLAGPGMARAAVAALMRRGDVDVDELAQRYITISQPDRETRQAQAVKGRSLTYWEAQLVED